MSTATAPAKGLVIVIALLLFACRLEILPCVVGTHTAIARVGPPAESAIRGRAPEVEHGTEIGAGQHLESTVTVEITRLGHAIVTTGMIG